VGTIVHELGKVCCNRGIRPPGWKTVKEGVKIFGACNAFLRTKLTDQIVETWRSETVFFQPRVEYLYYGNAVSYLSHAKAPVLAGTLEERIFHFSLPYFLVLSGFAPRRDRQGGNIEQGL